MIRKLLVVFLSILSLALILPQGSSALAQAVPRVSPGEVEQFIQYAYRLRTNAVSNLGVLSQLGQIYAPNSQKLWEYEQRRAEFWRHWADSYGQLVSFTSTASLIPQTFKQEGLRHLSSGQRNSNHNLETKHGIIHQWTLETLAGEVESSKE